MNSASFISVRTKDQAMDWSLVLASQGIESVIQHDAATDQWRLEVEPQSSQKAFQILRLYIRENRNRRWQREIQFTGMLFDSRCVLWALIMICAFYLQESLPADLKTLGRMDAEAVRNGEWWRVFTATLLHSDLGHLAANLSIGIVLSGLAMGAYGFGTSLVLGPLAAGIGNLTVCLFHKSHYLSIGSSSMVMAFLGLLVADSLNPRHEHTRQTAIHRGILSGVLLLILLGLNPGTDVQAHVAGFLWGFILGIIHIALFTWKSRNRPEITLTKPK